MTRSTFLSHTTPIGAFALTFAMLLPTGMTAATLGGEFATRGIGSESCSVMVDAILGPNSDAVSGQLASWLAGYISSASRLTPDVFDAMPIQNIYGVATLALRICERNEDALVETVAATVLEGFSGLASAEAEVMQVIDGNGIQLQVRTNVIKSVQDKLADQGFLESGFADGIYGANTEAALLLYQQSMSLEQTGLPDALTLFSLLFESP